ncbi:polysaccharide biosynthesis/export family protein [Pikeienuella sp. HZG-20]|uniref:polysaccharide biosynthesis/export family protein n=1 Tax=Paludibacillus litoralis TaxID=3133267 RepID=UPI0030EB4F99
MPRFIIMSCAFFVMAFFAASSQAQVVEPGDDLYRLAPGDSVEVTVLEDPSLNRQVLILPDGRISLPIAGMLTAEGKTPEELAARIRAGLSGIFVSPPTVTVSAIGLNAGAGEEIPEVIYVVGEVRQPGAYPFKKPMTVMQTLALAGGPGPFAARSRIQIHHSAGGVTTVETFDYEALEDGEMVPPGPLLADGDVIVVPERSLFD